MYFTHDISDRNFFLGQNLEIFLGVNNKQSSMNILSFDVILFNLLELGFYEKSKKFHKKIKNVIKKI